MFIKRSSWPLGVRMASWETIVTDVDAPMLLKVKRHHSSPRARELSGDLGDGQTQSEPLERT